MVKGILTLLVTSLAGLSFAIPSSSERSRDDAIRARATWSAFVCSTLASKSGDGKEQARLFQFGYEQGHKFIAAMKAKEISEDDLRAETPVMVLLLLEGPTPDFMLGRIYESAQDAALSDVFKTGTEFNSEGEQKLLAKGKFANLNCQLIGRQQ